MLVLGVSTALYEHAPPASVPCRSDHGFDIESLSEVLVAVPTHPCLVLRAPDCVVQLAVDCLREWE